MGETSAAHVSCSKRRKKCVGGKRIQTQVHPCWIWASNFSSRRFANLFSLLTRDVLLLHTNRQRQLSIMYYSLEKCLHDKYLNVLGFFSFFYSFVYDTSLEMCLNGNVLLWNLRDTYSNCLCGFICWFVLFGPPAWGWGVVVLVELQESLWIRLLFFLSFCLRAAVPKPA